VEGGLNRLMRKEKGIVMETKRPRGGDGDGLLRVETNNNVFFDFPFFFFDFF